MSRYLLCVAAVVLMAVFSLMVGAGCDRGSPAVVMPSVSASSAGKAALAEFDANKDGKIDQEELKKCPSLMLLARRLNPGGEPSLTAAQITERIKELQKSRVGLMMRAVQVLHNGKPFEGATVKYVPEKFMGDKFPVCSATVGVGVNGIANPSKPINKFPDDLPGVAPGFYRVEITKEGENVPAKYNTESVNGAEIGPGADGAKITINVIY